MSTDRRTFFAALAGSAAAGASDDPAFYRGVELGLQSFSLKDRSLDQVLEDCLTLGLHSVELWSGHLEPRRDEPAGSRRERLRRWRIEEGVAACDAARKKFAGAGIRLNAFNLSLRNDASDEEIDAAFRMTRRLGVDVLTSSSNVSTAKRLEPFAIRFGVRVGFHNHARIKPDEFATPDDFALATQGLSELLGVNLDTGHFHAAGFDNVAFIQRHHDRIFTLHMKDRQANDGPKVPFGRGSTPLVEVLQLLKVNGWRIPANIEMAYVSDDPLREVRESLDYMKRGLDR